MNSDQIKVEDKKVARIYFKGGAVTPTGSNFLLEVGDKNFLIDCGLYQGGRESHDLNREKFDYDVKSIDALFVTHAHLDHVGRIPVLTRNGYTGPIYSTAPTKEIGELIMMDSMGLLLKESEREGLPPMYEEVDVKMAMRDWHAMNYHEILPIQTSIGILKVKLLDSGHIMGGSIIEFEINGKKIVFTGDLGNTPSPLLKDTESIKGADYLVIESVYGDRNHEHVEDRVKNLHDIIVRTINRGGTLMIPAFSIERTQELLFHINDMVEKSNIPKVSIYLDSPLGINVTKVYKKYAKQFFNQEANKIISGGDDIFKFPGLVESLSSEDSKKINNNNGAKVIIAGSGMSNGGRIQHHESRYLSDPKATLLLVGYQAVGTLGRQIQEGNKKVKIFGQDIRVKCEVVTIQGFSAHKDSSHLVEFVGEAHDTLKKVFVVLGEPKSAMFLAQRINEYYGIETHLPVKDEIVEIVL